MTRSAVISKAEHTLHAALELSKNSWLLAIQFPERDAPSLYPLRGGDAEGLMAKLDAARDRVAKITGRTPTVPGERPVVARSAARSQAPRPHDRARAGHRRRRARFLESLA